MAGHVTVEILIGVQNQFLHAARQTHHHRVVSIKHQVFGQCGRQCAILEAEELVLDGWGDRVVD